MPLNCCGSNVFVVVSTLEGLRGDVNIEKIKKHDCVVLKVYELKILIGLRHRSLNFCVIAKNQRTPDGGVLTSRMVTSRPSEWISTGCLNKAKLNQIMQHTIHSSIR
ncbi:hypothetical protein F2P81_004867 [Scophthalmus maximus]|uniref:Uncharacterized protein n=1 Tax=Scophthalmus maximus TaxID=52904 RepID=A0A6A4TIJ2_SCOMX|nr:hypothetical protein F2P81_004867 [Scophthalmus maximus]